MYCGQRNISATHTHLLFRHYHGLLDHNPDDALVQRGGGQGSQVGPVVEAAGQEALGVETFEICNTALKQEYEKTTDLYYCSNADSSINHMNITGNKT